jgi:hypothetical protein
MQSPHTFLGNELLKRNSEFTIAEAKENVNHVLSDHKKTIDTQDRFHNTFFHEICPLLLIAEHIMDEVTRIVFMGDNSRFDGLLLLGEARSKQKIEMTAAIDGRNDALQMELQKERKHVPLFQKN